MEQIVNQEVRHALTVTSFQAIIRYVSSFLFFITNDLELCTCLFTEKQSGMILSFGDMTLCCIAEYYIVSQT